MATTFNSEQAIEALYIGYFGRAGDPSGVAYWVNQLNSGMSISQIAASFAVQPEATALYSFLANPTNTTAGAVTAFVIQVYQDLFNRYPDSSGQAYWTQQLEAANGNPALIGQFIENVISGAQGFDAFSIQNKVTVAQDFTDSLGSASLPFNSTADQTAHSVIAATTSDPSSVSSEEAVVSNYIAGQTTSTSTPASTTYVLTTGIDTIHSTNPNDVVSGTIAPSAAGTSTLNAGDSVAFSGGTLEILDTNTATTENELAGVNISGSFTLETQVLGSAQGYDFSNAIGVTKVISANSTQTAYFIDLPGSATVESIGASVVDFATNAAGVSGPVNIQFDGGFGGTIENLGGSTLLGTSTTQAAATVATILSTGGPNGSLASPDFYTVDNFQGTITSETLIATTNFIGGQGKGGGDWENYGAPNTDTLTVTGTASTVNLLSGADYDANTMSSTTFAGSLTISIDADVNLMTLGNGSNIVFLSALPGATADFNLGTGNNQLLENTSLGPLVAGTIVNGGSSGATDVISATLLSSAGSAPDASNISNFNIIDLGFASGTYDASLFTGDSFTGVTYGNNGNIAAGATTVSNLVGTTETLSVTGATSSFDETNLIRVFQANAPTATSSTNDHLIITFANTDIANSTTSFAPASGGTSIVTSHLVSLTINADTTVTGGAAGTVNDAISQLADEANLLKTVTITGSASFDLGNIHHDGIFTDVGAPNPGSATTLASSLTLVDGSSATGNLFVNVGFSGQPTNAPNLTMTYTGLTVKGGAGVDELINGAASGNIVLGSGGIDLGPATTAIAANTGETVTVGSGFDQIGVNQNGLSSTFISGGAFQTVLVQPTTVGGAFTSGQDSVNVSAFTSFSGAPTDFTALSEVTSNSGNLFAAEQAVANALGNNSVGYFTLGGSEYIVATGNSAATYGNDAVVTLTGGTFHGLAASHGVLTLGSVII